MLLQFLVLQISLPQQLRRLEIEGVMGMLCRKKEMDSKAMSILFPEGRDSCDEICVQAILEYIQAPCSIYQRTSENLQLILQVFGTLGVIFPPSRFGSNPTQYSTC